MAEHELAPSKANPMGWKELYLKEDWWAIYVGFGIALVCLIAFMNGSTFHKISCYQSRRIEMGLCFSRQDC